MPLSLTDYTAVIRSPPDTVDDAHDFLMSVWVERTDVAAADRNALETVLSELVTNVIQSNPDRQIQCEVTLSICPGLYELETRDTGAELVHAPASSIPMPGDMAEHGRGLPLIQRMADSFTYRHEDSHNIWRVRRWHRP